jgi:hypothetical protein
LLANIPLGICDSKVDNPKPMDKKEPIDVLFKLKVFVRYRGTTRSKTPSAELAQIKKSENTNRKRIVFLLKNLILSFFLASLLFPLVVLLKKYAGIMESNEINAVR